jgi:hypothetical protein
LFLVGVVTTVAATATALATAGGAVLVMVSGRFTISVVGCGASKARGILVDTAADGDTAKVQELLESGVDINGHPRDDWTPLTVVAREGHIGVVRPLLKHGADGSQREGGGHTKCRSSEARSGFKTLSAIQNSVLVRKRAFV